MGNTFLFRADGNGTIGAGHLMRCLTIASALRKKIRQQDEIFFVCSQKASAKLVEERGFSAYVTYTDYREMEMELPIIQKLLGQSNASLFFLVDSYYVTVAYLAALQKYGKVLLLDDMGDTTYPVDYLINYNVFATQKGYEKRYGGCLTTCFLGGAYVPLREEFSGRQYRVRDKVQHVLITTGGGDQENIGGTILQKLLEKFPQFTYHLVVGRFHPKDARLSWLTQQGVVLEQDVKDMAQLMEKCDVCISAGGTTVYEVSALGVPLICFSYARNQEALTEYVGLHEIAFFSGAWHLDPKKTLAHLCGQFQQLIEKKELREQFWEKERSMVDGFGAQRIAEKLLESV